MKSVSKTVALGLVCFLSCCSTLFALSVEVNDTGDLLSPPPPKITLRSAIAAANSSPTPTTITFKEAVFTPHQTITLSGFQLQLSKPMTITGPAAGVTISGNNASRVFEIDSSVTATLSNVTITAGSGGGIHTNSSDLTLTNVTVSGNTSSTNYCPGISSELGKLTLRDVTVSGNIHSGYRYGGGIYNSGNATLTNVAVFGNAISGSSYAYGGGICNQGTATLTNVTVSGNTILSDYGSYGGGIFNFNNKMMTLTNVSVSGNTASTSVSWADGGCGGGIFNDAALAAFTIANTIVANNNALKGGAPSPNGPDVYGGFNSLGYNLIGKTDGSWGFSSPDLLGTIASPRDPKLGLLADNAGPTLTMALLGGSPAIDHGYNLYISGVATDQRGLSRIVNGNVDIGAYEYQLIVSTPSTPSLTLLTLPATIQGTAGTPTDFTVRGIGLGSFDTLTLSAPTGSEISQDGWSFSSTFDLHADDSGNLQTTVHARIKASATDNVDGDLTFVDTLYPSLNKSVPVRGTVQQVISVTVQSNPSGRSFTVDGTTYTSAQIFSWGSGSSHTIATTSPQSGGTGIQYVWSSWSDSGPMLHTVAPTVDNTTYTAIFTTQYYLTMIAGTGGSVSPASGWYNSGVSVEISATAAGGYDFSSWTGTGDGSYSGGSNPASVTMNGPITETANFDPLPQVATPTFEPAPGTYTTSVDVTISCLTGGATIRYTTDGSTPTSSHGTVIASGASVHLTVTTTLQAIAYKAGMANSAIASGLYTIQVAMPTFAPPPATYVGSVDVTISCGTGGATIRYTTDGTDPTASSPLYTPPVHITTTTTLKARAFKTGMANSAIASGDYTIQVATPTFAPPAGTYNPSVDVTISCTTAGATIHYTTDGTDPKASSPLYASPVHITTTTTLKARAFKTGMANSAIASGLYTIQVAQPTFAPPQGLYNLDLDITILCATFGAEIHYTTNDATPTSGSALYSGPVHITTSTTLKAIAVKSGATDSGIAQGFYQLDKQKPVTSDLSTIPTKVKAGVDLAIAVYAQATDVGTGDLNIVDAECFIGSAPGLGGGTHMNAADGAYDSSTESLVCPALSTEAYTTPGSLQVHARAKDAAGNWSDVATVIVQVVTAIPPGQVTDLTVSPQDAYETLPLTLVSVSGGETTGFAAANLVDGNAQSYWKSPGSASADEQSIVVDLTEVKEIAAVALVAAPKSGPFPRKFTIAASEDATTWTTVAQAIDLKSAAKTRYIWQFQAVDARYVKVYGAPVWNSREMLWYWQMAEIEVPLHFGTTAAVLEWTAPADDGHTGTRAAAYDVRYSNSSISAGDFGSRPALGAVGGPADPGSHETVNADISDIVGRVFAALKTRDSEYNWSPMSNIASAIVGGARIRSLAPSDAALLSAGTPPVFTFGVGSIVKSVSASVSSSAAFPSKPARRLTGEMDSTARFAMKSGSTMWWMLSASQWKAIKKVVLPDGIVHWRMEGKATINKAPAVLFGPMRSAYFEMGSITGLTVGPSPSPHTVDGKDALWATVTPAPLLIWTNNAPNAVKFFIDVSTDANAPAGDKLFTVTLGGKGVAATSYQLTAADWKKVRKLATKGDGMLYWRVRGTDKDGLLGCGSAIRPLVIDGGNWTVSSLGNLSATPAAITWATDADGLVKCGLQFSVDDQFEKLSSMTVKVPTSAVAYSTGYTLTAADVTKLTNRALKNGLDKLYYRVYAEDAEKAFVAHSPFQIVNVP